MIGYCRVGAAGAAGNRPRRNRSSFVYSSDNVLFQLAPQVVDATTVGCEGGDGVCGMRAQSRSTGFR